MKKIPLKYRLTYEERVALLEQWKYFGWKLAMNWFKYSPVASLEEYQAAVVEGFWEASAKFDKRRNLKFTTYAKWYATKCCRILMIQSKGFKVGHWKDYGKVVTIQFEFDLPQKFEVEAKHMIDIWNIAKKLLDPNRFAVLQMRYEENKTLAEIAKCLKVSPEWARQLSSTALKALRKHFKSHAK